MKSDEKYIVQGMEGSAKNCEVIAPDFGMRPKRNVTFVKNDAGKVFYIGRTTARDIRRTWAFNDAERRVWCRLSGVKFADLKASMKSLKDAEEKASSKSDLDRLKTKAAKAGYRLIRSS